MNAAEQRQRHTAVMTAERRIDDVETVFIGLAQSLVDDRAESGRRLQSLEQEATEAAANAARLQRLIEADRIASQEGDACIRALLPVTLTFWGRLRWLVGL